MIFWSLSLPAKVQQRTGIPSRVTAIAITTWEAMDASDAMYEVRQALEPVWRRAEGLYAD
jgi:hypothetical protein